MSTSSPLAHHNSWAPSADEGVGKSMSLKVVQQARTGHNPRLPVRAQSAAPASQRPPVSLSTVPVEAKPVRESTPLSLVNIDGDHRKAKAQRQEFIHQQYAVKPKTEDTESFVRGTNSVVGIGGARPKTAAHGCSSFHQSSSRPAHADDEVKRNPLDPQYQLPEKSMLQDSIKRVRPATAVALSKPRDPQHPWDQTTESQRACKLRMTKEINGEKRKDTQLLPKPDAVSAARYMDYSDVARSTNRWYLEEQERKAKIKKSLTLATADVNNKKLQWNSHFTRKSPQKGSVDGEMHHRVSDPLSPRYTHDGEEYGGYEKHIRLGFRFWKSNRRTNSQHTTQDVEGAQPTAHAQPLSVKQHRAKHGNPPPPTLPSEHHMAATKAKRFETNDIFGAAETDQKAVALHGKEAAFALSSNSEAQHQYRPVKQRIDLELQQQWDIAHAGGPNHPGCTFHKERSGGRGTAPTMPMYTMSRQQVNSFSSSPSWIPQQERLEKAGGGVVAGAVGLRSNVSEKEKAQCDRSLKQFETRKENLRKNSAAQKLKEEIAAVRNLA